MKHILIALRLLLVMMILTGIIYPLAITGIVQVLFQHQAKGSMTIVGETIKGSELVGQKFIGKRYFWSRPSAIDYNPLPSGATNLGPTSAALQAAVFQRRAHFDSTRVLQADTTILIEMLFASASGVDPHISPEAARLQIDRIARARNFSPEQKAKLIKLVESHIELLQWGIFGEPRVNVFLLNLAVDKLTLGCAAGK